MRIAYLSGDRGVPVFGTKGASVHVRELARALASLGHEVVVLTTRADGPRPTAFRIPVRQVTAGPEQLDPEARAISFRDRALPFLRDFRPHVLYERYSLFGTAGIELSRELGIPLLLEVNAPLADEAARHRALDRVEAARAAERAVLGSATSVLAVSTWVARWAQAQGVAAERIAIVPNAVDPARFCPQPGERATVRAELGLDGGPAVGFVGTLKPWHDVGTLVAALALLPATRPRLVMVGAGPERDRIAREAERLGVATTFTGSVPHDSVPSYLAALDAAVAPYAKSDSFYFSPLKLVEYLAAGRPVVAANVGEISHCVRPGETGLLYEAGDAAGLANAVRELLDDPARAAELGARGREHVIAEHTWAQNARRVIGLARTVLERRHAA
jgi:alpha-maltose-1-phosphate synthase